MKKYVLHIVTKPHDRETLLANAPVFKASANLKDPLKIAENIQQRQEKYLAEAGDNAATASVYAAVVLNVDNQNDYTILRVGTAPCPNEKALLLELLDLLAEGAVEETLTFRGLRHVYPFLIHRSAMHMDMTVGNSYTYYNLFADVVKQGELDEELHFDLAKAWAFSGSQPEELHEILNAMGIAQQPSRAPNWELFEADPELADDELLLYCSCVAAAYCRLTAYKPAKE